jgi:hypothetical protein
MFIYTDFTVGLFKDVLISYFKMVQNYNFTCGFVRVWNLVSHVKGRT